MRLFVGIEFPTRILEGLALCQEAVRAKAAKGRFKRRENFHLTLKFLGEVATDRLPELQKVLGAIREPRFSLHLGHLGQFGGGNPVRVVWVDVAGDMAQMIRLQQRVEAGLGPIGFAAESRPWRPHITLAQDVVFAGEKPDWNKVAVPQDLFVAEEFALILSEEVERRREYTPIQRIPLA